MFPIKCLGSLVRVPGRAKHVLDSDDGTRKPKIPMKFNQSFRIHLEQLGGGQCREVNGRRLRRFNCQEFWFNHPLAPTSFEAMMPSKSVLHA